MRIFYTNSASIKRRNVYQHNYSYRVENIYSISVNISGRLSISRTNFPKNILSIFKKINILEDPTILVNRNWKDALFQYTVEIGLF